MQLEQGFALPTAPAVAWPLFRNIELLVECLPGASLTGPAEAGVWPMRLDVKLGPISAAFAGSGGASFDDGTHSGRFEGSATDKRTNSRVKGLASFSLRAEGTGSWVQVEVDYTLTGTLAQFSRGGLVRDLAAAMTEQFAANLSARLQAQPAAQVETPPPAAPLDAGGLLKTLLLARCRRLLAWLRRSRA
jgi:uncharacterized protein